MPDEFQKYIIVDVFGEGLALAYHLQCEGKEVITCMVDDLTYAMEKEDDEGDAKKYRLSQYNGLLKKITPDELMKIAEKIENKEEWFCIFDFNTIFKYADEFKKMGFTNGLFPTRLDYVMESDRDFAKRFVVKSYPGIKVAEVEQFKDVQEGIDFVNESDEFWALKGNDAGATTVVPSTKLIDNVRAELIDALQSGKETYERKGFILERQIRDGLEVCPEMIFYNGQRVASNIDLEDKSFSATDGAEKFGCAINVIRQTDMNCLLNQVAFPEATDKLAKRHAGLYYIDANLILKDGEYYFLEFCSGRMGFDAIFGECEMAGGTAEYFNALSHGMNPYKKKFAAGTRGFAMKKEDDGSIKDGISIRYPAESEEHLWFFGVQRGDGKIVNNKGSFGDSVFGIDLVAFTESSDDLEFACHKLNNLVSSFSFNGLYTRRDLDCVCGRVEGLEKFINEN